MKYKNAKLLLLGLLVISITLVISSQIPAGHGFAQQQDPGKQDLQKQNPQKEDPEYSCPMHPEVKSKKPGSCPKCGMTLKQKSTERESAANTDVNSGPNRFPNVELITQDGKKVHFYDDLIKGKVVAI